MKKLREIMRPDFVFVVPRQATVLDAVHTMAKNNVGIVAVVDGSRLVGVFSERDVVQRVLAATLDPGTTEVDQVMTRSLVVAGPDDDCRSAMRTMDQANIRHLPVVSGDRLLSMLSVRDLMRVEIQAQGAEIQHLHEYLYQVPAASVAAAVE